MLLACITSNMTHASDQQPKRKFGDCSPKHAFGTCPCARSVDIRHVRLDTRKWNLHPRNLRILRKCRNELLRCVEVSPHKPLGFGNVNYFATTSAHRITRPIGRILRANSNAHSARRVHADLLRMRRFGFAAEVFAASLRIPAIVPDSKIATLRNRIMLASTLICGGIRTRAAP